MLTPPESTGPSEFELRAKAHVAIREWLDALRGPSFDHDRLIVWAIKEIRKRSERKKRRS